MNAKIDKIGQVLISDITSGEYQVAHRPDQFYVARKALLKRLWAKRQAAKISK